MLTDEGHSCRENWLLNATPVERIDRLSKKKYKRNFLNALKPVVITNAVENWPATNSWSPNYIKGLIGEETVTIDDGQYKIKELIDLIEASDDANPAPYLRHINIRKELRKLEPDVSPRIQYATPDRLESIFLPKGGYSAGGEGYYSEFYMGGAGAGFPILHYDIGSTHAISIQLFGEKKFVLFPPDQGELLYPKKRQANHSQIENVFEPDFSIHPMLSRTSPYVVTLAPGEALFIPSRWWHTTRILSFSLSLSTSFVTRSCWNNYRKDVYRMEQEWQTLPKSLAKDLYLRVTGKLMTVAEIFSS